MGAASKNFRRMMCKMEQISIPIQRDCITTACFLRSAVFFGSRFHAFYPPGQGLATTTTSLSLLRSYASQKEYAAVGFSTTYHAKIAVRRRLPLWLSLPISL